MYNLEEEIFNSKVKLQDIYDDIYEDCDSALADDFYKGLENKIDENNFVDLADAEVQLYIRDYLETHEKDYQYDLLKRALGKYYDPQYDIVDDDIEESYEVLEEDVEEDHTFEEIIDRMEFAEIYEDLYNAAMCIANPKLQTRVTKAIQQCEDDGDDVEEAYSIVTSDILDMYRNDKNVENLNEEREITSYDKDYLKRIKSSLEELEVSSFEELQEELDRMMEYEITTDDEYDMFCEILSEHEDKCEDYINRRSKVTNTDWKDELGIEEDYVKTAIEEMIKSIKIDENKEIKIESEENPQEFDYRLLSRLKSDCDYYLGNGNRNAEHCLWAKNEQGQIDKMREIYNQLKEKPEWLSEEDINNYAKEMGVVDLPSTTDGTAEKEVQDMLDRAEKREKEGLTEAEDMEAVKDEIETAKEETENTDQEIEQVQGSIDVLKTDEESAIDGYDTFIEDTKEVVDPELANAIEDQMEEIKADEEEHIEKLDTIKNALDEAKGQAPDFKVDFEGDMTIDMGYTDEEGAEKRAEELLDGIAKSSNVRDLNVDVKDVKKTEKENKELKKEGKIIWSSQYDFDGTTADEAYQEYLDEFESIPVEPKSFEEWLEDTKDIWFDAEANRYKEEHPGEIDKLSDFEIDEIDAQLRDNVEKEIEANMDDLKDQYEEYVEEFKKENNMTTPEDKERWQMSWYEQDADAQWEVKDADFTNNVFPMIESQCNDDILLLFGSVGLWNGTFDGGKMIKAEESELRKIMGDYDEVIVEADEDNHIAMKFVHHDGVHYMQLFTIPEDLTELAKAMEYEDADELYSDIVNGYVDEEELAKHPDLLVPIIDKGGNDNE